MNEKNKEITIDYTNWKNITCVRRIRPIDIWFGVSEWHTGEQWFLKAIDVEKNEERDFALLGIKEVRNVQQPDDSSDTGPVLKEVKLFTDGGSRGNPGPSAVGIAIHNLDDELVRKESKYIGITTNNQAEYQALKLGLELCRSMGIPTVQVHMDSLLVINQMKGLYKVKNIDLLPVYQSVKELQTKFKQVSFTHVPRELNKIADGMVNECLDSEID